MVGFARLANLHSEVRVDIAIEITELRKTYRGKKGAKVEALQGLSMLIMRNEAFGLLGPNGAGKSTAIKILIGLIRPSSGSFSIQGISGGSQDIRRHIGYLPENPAFFESLTGKEFLSYVGRSYGMPTTTIHKRSSDLLEQLDLVAAAKRPIRTYSKGMIQRIGLAQCLLHDPQILILDEPMSGLDPTGRMLVRDMLLQLRRAGKCILMSTHIMYDVETICDRVGILSRGSLQCIESIEKINTEGITSYRISVEGISQQSLHMLEETGAVTLLDRTGSHCLLLVPRERLESVLRIITAEQNARILLIDPVRKGLEELFAAVTQ